MTEAAKMKPVKSVEDFIAAARKTTTTPTAEVKKEESTQDFAGIQNNTFYKILLDPSLSPTEKKEATAKALAFEGTRDEVKERLQEFNKFKEFLQFERKRMARQIIDLTDTDAFGELKGVYEDINNALIDFEDRIKPLTDAVDAVYKLRMNGMTFDVVREITQDREAEEQRRILHGEQSAKLKEIEDQIKGLRYHNAELGQQKSFFGFGGLTKDARTAMARNDLELTDKQAELRALAAQIEESAKVSEPPSQFGEFAEEKAKLRELLDISTEDHKVRQEALVNAARTFITTTEDKVGSVLVHFSGMNDQIERLGEANYSMREIYAILNDATQDASKTNQTKREELSKEIEGEGDIQKMTRERTLRDLEGHITSLGQSNIDTTTVFADLTAHSNRIKSMKDGNDQQINKTRTLHTSGVAGVADQLSTVLQAVSSAALGESSEMARMSLERMNRTTLELGQKEVIRVALGTQEINTELGKALENLESTGEVIRTATGIVREGLTETRRLRENLEQTARDVQADIKESFGIAADVTAGKGGVRPSGKPANDSAPQSAPPANPFGLKDGPA